MGSGKVALDDHTPAWGRTSFWGVFCQKRIRFKCWVKTTLANFDDQSYPHLGTQLFFGVFSQKRIPFKWWVKTGLTNFDDLLAVA